MIRSLISKIKTKIKKSRFIKFLFVGIINTIFGYSVFAILIILRLDYQYALLIATICGVMFNFKTIGTLVFKTKNNELIFRFIGVYCVIYI
ncbi:MAG: GtrA family protein, partial [Pseudanabaena sp.]